MATKRQTCEAPNEAPESEEITSPEPDGGYRDASEAADICLTSTAYRAGEALAEPLRPHRPPSLPHATPDAHDTFPIPDDFSGLERLAGDICALFTQNTRLAAQAAELREMFGDGDLLRLLFHNLFPAQTARPAVAPEECSLTEMEQRVLGELARDISRQEIAERLGNSRRTIDTHIYNLFKKLGVKRPMQAVARGVSMGYLPLDTFTFITGAANCGARNFRGIDSLISGIGRLDEEPFAAHLQPLAEFALLLLVAAGTAAKIAYDDEEGRPDRPGVVCEVNAAGEIVRTFGQEHLGKPGGIAVAPPAAARQGFTPGNLFVSHGNLPFDGLNRGAIAEFTLGGRFVRAFSGGREIGSALSDGRGITFHNDGRLLVPSGLPNSILAFGDGGAHVRRLSKGYCCADQVCVGPNGDVYATVYSSVGCRVKVFDAQGNLRASFAETPAGANLVGLAVSSRGHVFVNRHENERENERWTIEEYDPDGGHRRTILVAGLGRCTLATDAEDRLYVPCLETGDIKVLALDGRVERCIDLRGEMMPQGVTIGKGGRLWVCGQAA